MLFSGLMLPFLLNIFTRAHIHLSSNYGIYWENIAVLSSFDKISFTFSVAYTKHPVVVYILLIKGGAGKRMKIMQEEGQNSLRSKYWNNLLLFTTLISKKENNT